MDMDMKHGHGHGPRTWRWSSTMDAGMPIKGLDRHHYFSVSLQYFSFQSLKSCPHGEIHMNMNINTDSDMVTSRKWLRPLSCPCSVRVMLMCMSCSCHAPVYVSVRAWLVSTDKLFQYLCHQTTYFQRIFSGLAKASLQFLYCHIFGNISSFIAYFC
jgi:hypothetical protein